jgi:peptide/nickel transport system substrate-binding protein
MKAKELVMSGSSTSKRRGIAVAAALTLVAGLAACSGGGDTAGTDGRAEELNIAYFGTVVDLNPALAGSGPSAGLIALAYDPLIYLTADGEYVPDLATEWGFTDDANTVFELTLRDGVEFGDGSELDADAVVASMEYFRQAGGGSVAGIGPIDTVEAVDASTVRVTYLEPFPDAPYSMAQYVKFGSIIGAEGLADAENLPTSVDGLGQYTLNEEDSVTNSRYVFERNPDYWNPDAQMYETVTVQVLADPNAALSAIQTGQVDYTLGDASTLDSATAAGLEILQVPFFNWTLHIADRDGSLNPALQDVRVRQALAHAVNREGIVNAIGPDVAEESTQVMNEGTVGYVDGIGYEYDPEKAKELLAEAGYPDGFSMTVLATSAIDAQALRAQAITDSLEQVGVDVDLTIVTTGIPAFSEEAETQTYDATIWPVSGTTMSLVYPDLNVTVRNPSGITDPELDAMYAESLTASESERLEIFEQMSERITELSWMVPVLTSNDIHYVGEDLTNVKVTGANPIPTPVGPAPEYAWQPAN